LDDEAAQLAGCAGDNDHDQHSCVREGEVLSE
jgi:hypothetical protein